MDISQFSTVSLADEGAELELVSPRDGSVLRDPKTGEPITVTLLGSDSKEYQRLTHKIQNKRLQQRLGRGAKVKLTAEEIEADALELLVKCTKSWKHIGLDGQDESPCTEQNARRVYTEHPWIREQVSDFVEDRSNFLGE